MSFTLKDFKIIKRPLKKSFFRELDLVCNQMKHEGKSLIYYPTV